MVRGNVIEQFNSWELVSHFEGAKSNVTLKCVQSG
jgi:hypothetical protein